MTRAEQKQVTRERLFQAALQAFREHGVQAARIEDIAAAVQVSRGTFYFHFPTREAVLDQLLEEAEAELCTALQALDADAPLTVVLETMALAYAERWKDEPKLFVEVGLYGVRRTSKTVMVQERHGVREELGRRFGLAEGQLRPGLPPEVLADFYLVNAFTVGLAWSRFALLTGSANPDIPLAEALRLSAELFLQGAGA